MKPFIKNTAFFSFVGIASSLALSSANLQAATIIENLGGLFSPIGAATNGNKDRQYAWTTSGGEVTVTYTLTTNAGDLSVLHTTDDLFRYTPPNSNLAPGQELTITINTIAANAGYTLNSVSKSNTVTLAVEGTKTARFSVNGGATFDYVGTGPTGSNTQETVTNAQFANFNGPGDSLFFRNMDQTTFGGQNIRNLGFTFDVDVIPEPSSLALLAAGGLLIASRRRRNA